jgi:hypothetical protein
MLELKILPYPLTYRHEKENLEEIFRSPVIDYPPDDHITIEPISSTHGQIKTLFFTLPKDNEARDQYNFFRVLNEIIEKMPLVEKFIIVFRGYELDVDIDFKKKLYANNKVELLIIKNVISRDYSDGELSIWAQDHFYPIKLTDTNTDETTIGWAVGNLDSNYLSSLKKLIPLKKEKDSTQSKDVVSILDRVEIKTTGLPFQGGNILVGDKFIIIGQNDSNLTDYKKWFGMEPIFVKTSVFPVTQKTYISTDKFRNNFPIFQERTNLNQPIFHIDMFLTLAGFDENKLNYTIVVGKPVLGVQKLEQMDKKLYHFINKWLTQIQASICSCIEHLKIDFKERLNIKLEIISTPLVLTYSDIVDKERKERKWFWATYNNCLVQNIEATKTQKSSKKVWIPTYGSPSSSFIEEPMNFHLRTAISKNLHRDFLSIKYGDWTDLQQYDIQSKLTWESLGFEVCLLQQSYIPFACQYGALNCFTNCIERHS